MSFKGMAKCKSCKEETIDLKGTYPGLYYECSTCGDIFTATRIFEEKEKTESELKAIKDRINGIAEIPTIENGVFVKDCRWNAGYNTGVSDCKEIIKQIGGVK